uniref:RNA polymerase sigma factor RpoN n=1 Tax=Aquifex aeolicus TaxID=63363 RepID=UPI0001753B03|nr:Chain A, RNA polymerase sigma factor RpoN [Aquifex aeolicus]2O9L_A Chain A, RNA polymerase sigma factor RpoN [Aquifex aeolicus]
HMLTQGELMKLIKEIVENEDKRKPYSDQEIANILKEKGFKVARRTVAKYREMLGIPSSRERRI